MNRIDLAQTNAIITAAVADVPNHDGLSRVKPSGTLMALTSPAFNEIMNTIDPLGGGDNSRIEWENSGVPGMPRPTVKVTHKPANAAATQTTRSAVGTSGVKPSAGVSSTYVGDIYIETVDAVEFNPANDLATVDVENYYKQWVSGQIDISAIMKAEPSVGRIARNIYQRTVKDIIPKLNKTVAQKLMLAVGKIPAYPSEVLPTAASPQKTVYGFQHGNTTTEGIRVPNAATHQILKNMVDKAQTQGRPILIGGDIWKEYHDAKNIVAINYAGIDFGKVYSEVNYDFFYDQEADISFGDGVALLVEPNMVGFQTWNYADTNFITNATHYNMHYSTLEVNASQFKPSDFAKMNMSGTSYSLRMDMRAKEYLTDKDFPMMMFKPSVGGLWYYTPTGVLTTDSGDIYKDYTGVQAIKMLEFAP
jgi:hypothetical protein